MTADERYESLRHCNWVDEVIPDAPWVVTQEFLDKHRIDFVAHDSLSYADASGVGNDVYEFVKAAGKFKETKRTDGISTSDIIMRIVKDYNQYVMRNLDRGYTRKDLGVGYVKEKRLRVNMKLKKLQEKVKEQQEKVGEKRLPKKFVRLFGGDLADEVMLKVPNGSLWTVGLEMGNVDMWLKRGWTVFSNAFSLGFDSFLLFQYKGRLEFLVNIFDTTTCEIECPDCVPCGVRGDDARLTDETLDLLRSRNIAISRAIGVFTDKERGNIIEAVKLCNPVNASFLVVMRPNKQFQKYLYVPANFTKEHLSGVNQQVKLQDSAGNAWAVQLTASNGGRCKIKGGRPAFCRSQNLQAGDICIFELLDTSTSDMKVFVLPALG